MAISSYPRTIQVGQNAINGNSNSGTGLMLFDSTTNKYIAATPQTFSGGAGGATSANQDLQISVATQQKAEASNSNIFLENIYNELVAQTAILDDIRINQTNQTAILDDIRTNQTNQTQLTKIVGNSGNFAEVNSSNQLTVTTTT